MSWLFAVLIVLAMGGVAAVAAGRGRSMEPAYADRPDAEVPAAGPLSAEDLRRVRFPLALRGYRMAEVDALLDRLAREREDAGWQPRPVDPPADTPADPPTDRPVQPPRDASSERDPRGPGV